VERVALQHGGSALVFSLEMSAAELAMRAIASVGRVDFQRLRTGHEMTDDDWPRLTAGVSKLADAPILVDDAAGLSLIELRARARRVARERDLKLVVVDYLQLMAVDRRAESRHLALGEISTGLKALAKELRLPVLALSQLSREVERRQGRKPTLADLRDSGSLEADADVVLLLHQGRTDDDTPTGVADVVVAKQRNGPTGSVKLAFRGELCRFEDCAQTEEPIPLSRPRRPYRGGFDG
jgi:replicative DNA helicase